MTIRSGSQESLVSHWESTDETIARAETTCVINRQLADGRTSSEGFVIVSPPHENPNMAHHVNDLSAEEMHSYELAYQASFQFQLQEGLAHLNAA
eukprot:6197776-Pleurochrysis_carterae.AAC.1